MNENAIDEQPVREPNHLELARLVTEIAWRIDHGKAEGWRFVCRSFDPLFAARILDKHNVFA
jgi:hypothetical protein